MKQYRILKIKHYDNLYQAQKKWFIFWINIADVTSLGDAKWNIEHDQKRYQSKEKNPANTVVWESSPSQ